MAGAQSGNQEFRDLLRCLGQPSGTDRNRIAAGRTVQQSPGARALNYAELRRDESGGFTVQDHIGGTATAIEPALIINATGGWIDIANASLFSPETGRRH